MKHAVLTKGCIILEDVKVPLLKFVHDLENVRPLACANFDDLTEALFILLKLVLVNFSIFSVKLLEEVVEVALEPCSRIVRLLSRNIEPSFRLHVLLTLTILLK